VHAHTYNPRLSLFAKIICAATLGLIFAGGAVTSKNVGLAVPDWPTSFGYHMWGMPFSMWKAGVFYEHLHRVIASAVGLLVLVMSIWLLISERRRWIRRLGIACLLAVVFQGLLGGLTVKLTLPLSVSVSHGVLAQIFFGLTIVLAYGLSREHVTDRSASKVENARFAKAAWCLVALILLQLLVAVTMRHDMKHQGGIAVPDFPTVAERWWPGFDAEAVSWVNAWRAEAVWEHGAEFELTEPVRASQMAIHVIHRVLALLILFACIGLSVSARRQKVPDRVQVSLYVLDAFVVLQIMLGIMVVWSSKGELLATLHVTLGAATLGAAVLLAMRSTPPQATS
jgi:cytochrome c oxidase assembly protein subunit 15